MFDNKIDWKKLKYYIEEKIKQNEKCVDNDNIIVKKKSFHKKKFDETLIKKIYNYQKRYINILQKFLIFLSQKKIQKFIEFDYETYRIKIK